MIAPEILKRFSFFECLTNVQLQKIAQIAEEEDFVKDELIFYPGERADTFFILMEGGVDLYHVVADKDEPDLHRDFFVGHICPTEPFGLSVLIDPFVFTLAAVAPTPSLAITLDGLPLGEILAKDTYLHCVFLEKVSQTAMKRLQVVRAQLAASRHNAKNDQ